MIDMRAMKRFGVYHLVAEPQGGVLAPISLTVRAGGPLLFSRRIFDDNQGDHQ
jgi:hypothetical protein